MTEEITNNGIEVKLMNIEELFASSEISIPEYQREYVWREKNVSKLFNDVLEYFNKENIENKEYFLGSILLYNNDNKFEVIDGQQRIITLSLIYMEINKNSNFILNIYKSIFKKSKYNIKKNKEFIKNNIDDTIKKNINNIKFTAIITKKQDDAFIFFDTHNTSGVRLKTVDLLKAYHLRALKCNDEETKNIVEKWNRDNSNDGMVEILENMLFTIRKFKAKSNKYLIKKDDNEDYVLNEFKSKNSENNEIIFYPSSKNKLINNIGIENNSIFYSTNNSYLNLDKYSLPFLIRQPLSDGLCFFLYSGKYKKLYKYLFEDEETNMLKFLSAIYTNRGRSGMFLSNIFKYSVFLYYDKFENERLLEFALKLNYVIAYYRYYYDRIYDNIYRHIIIDGFSSNLFDIIDMHYDTNDVMEYFNEFINTHKIKIDEMKTPIKQEYLNNVKKYIMTIDDDLLTKIDFYKDLRS